MNDHIKVCMVAPVPPPYGGIANWYNLIMRYSAEKELPVDYSTINIAPKKRSTDGRNLFDRIFVSGIEMMKKRNELKRVIKDFQPQVIHITTSGQLALIRDIVFLKLAKRNKIPTVYHIRFGRVQEIAEKNTLEWQLIKRAIGHSNITIAIDKTTEQVLRLKCKASRICYIPNPFDISTIKNISKDQKSSNSIVFIGWVVKTKGVEELLEAWDMLSDIHDKYTLSIVGPAENEYVCELKEKYQCEKVEFVGELKHEDALVTLSKANLFILPSYTEGFPNSVLEAMAVGTPIIATRVGAIPEMLSDQCGMLIDSKSSDAIACAIREMIGNDENQKLFSKNAYKKVASDYSVERIMERYCELWNNNSEYMTFD